MSGVFTRGEAVLFLSLYRLAQLDTPARADHLLDVWPPDDPSFALPAFPFRPEDFSEDFPDNPDPPLYNPVLLGGLAYSYYGVTNEFLQLELQHKGFPFTTVTGEVEPLYPCPCCGYRSLTGIEYAICKICYWEDDGTDVEDKLSGPNHMTLRDYRREFLAKPISLEQKIRYLRDTIPSG